MFSEGSRVFSSNVLSRCGIVPPGESGVSGPPEAPVPSPPSCYAGRLMLSRPSAERPRASVTSPVTSRAENYSGWSIKARPACFC